MDGVMIGSGKCVVGMKIVKRERVVLTRSGIGGGDIGQGQGARIARRRKIAIGTHRGPLMKASHHLDGTDVNIRGHKTGRRVMVTVQAATENTTTTLALASIDLTLRGARLHLTGEARKTMMVESTMTTSDTRFVELGKSALLASQADNLPSLVIIPVLLHLTIIRTPAQGVRHA